MRRWWWPSASSAAARRRASARRATATAPTAATTGRTATPPCGRRRRQDAATSTASSDKTASAPLEDPVHPGELLATHLPRLRHRSGNDRLQPPEPASRAGQSRGGDASCSRKSVCELHQKRVGELADPLLFVMWRLCSDHATMFVAARRSRARPDNRRYMETVLGAANSICTEGATGTQTAFPVTIPREPEPRLTTVQRDADRVGYVQAGTGRANCCCHFRRNPLFWNEMGLRREYAPLTATGGRRCSG